MRNRQTSADVSSCVQPIRDCPTLGPLVDEHGELVLEPAEDPFPRLVVSIINQQVSTQSAAAIGERVFDRFEVTPESMLAADEELLRDAGLSNAKVRYVRSAAEAFQDGRITPARFDGMAEGDVVAELTDVTGIGAWTAKMYLMFVLGREDVFPIEDLGIRRGMELLYGDISRTEMVERAEPWRPYRSYASLYLWQHYENGDSEVGVP
jgi:DNA-3-methyladenine glycosylase II